MFYLNTDKVILNKMSGVDGYLFLFFALSAKNRNYATSAGSASVWWSAYPHRWKFS